MEEVLQFVNKYHVFYLATVEGDQPRVRPFGVLTQLSNGGIYTQTGNVKNVFKQIKANGKAELCCFGEGRWVRIQCNLVQDDRVEIRKELLDKNPSLRRMYDENDGNCEAIRLENIVATFYSFTEAPRTVSC